MPFHHVGRDVEGWGSRTKSVRAGPGEVCSQHLAQRHEVARIVRSGAFNQKQPFLSSETHKGLNSVGNSNLPKQSRSSGECGRRWEEGGRIEGSGKRTNAEDCPARAASGSRCHDGRRKDSRTTASIVSFFVAAMRVVLMKRV